MLAAEFCPESIMPPMAICMDMEVSGIPARAGSFPLSFFVQSFLARVSCFCASRNSGEPFLAPSLRILASVERAFLNSS